MPGRATSSVDSINLSQLRDFAYLPSKATIDHRTPTVFRHVAPRSITPSAIAPGPFPGKMMVGILEAFGEEIRKGVPLGRIGEPADMAGVAI